MIVIIIIIVIMIIITNKPSPPAHVMSWKTTSQPKAFPSSRLPSWAFKT